jgi:hypothetical protein
MNVLQGVHNTKMVLIIVRTIWVGRVSVVNIATHYELDGPRIESRCGRDFPHPSRPAVRRTQPRSQWVPGLFIGGLGLVLTAILI